MNSWKNRNTNRYGFEGSGAASRRRIRIPREDHVSKTVSDGRRPTVIARWRTGGAERRDRLNRTLSAFREVAHALGEPRQGTLGHVPASKAVALVVSRRRAGTGRGSPGPMREIHRQAWIGMTATRVEMLFEHRPERGARGRTTDDAPSPATCPARRTTPSRQRSAIASEWRNGTSRDPS